MAPKLNQFDTIKTSIGNAPVWPSAGLRASFRLNDQASPSDILEATCCHGQQLFVESLVAAGGQIWRCRLDPRCSHDRVRLMAQHARLPQPRFYIEAGQRWVEFKSPRGPQQEQPKQGETAEDVARRRAQALAAIATAQSRFDARWAERIAQAQVQPQPVSQPTQAATSTAEHQASYGSATMLAVDSQGHLRTLKSKAAIDAAIDQNLPMQLRFSGAADVELT